MLYHACKLSLGGHTSAEVFLPVYLDKPRIKVGGHAMTKFLDSVHAGSLEEFGKLSGHALDAE